MSLILPLLTFSLSLSPTLSGGHRKPSVLDVLLIQIVFRLGTCVGLWRCLIIEVLGCGDV